MSKNLEACPACGAQISKSARTCPQCGKPRTRAAGIIIAVIVGLAGGWLLTARTCAEAAQANREMDEAMRKTQQLQIK